MSTPGSTPQPDASSAAAPAAKTALADPFDARVQRPVTERIAELTKNDQPHTLQHVIFADQFSRPTLERLCHLAEAIRTIAKTDTGARALQDLLRHKRAMLYFTQPSTRTFLSFTAACQILGISCNEVRDPRLSSEVKGESVYDSIRMFGSYFDVVIMRTITPQLSERCAYLVNDIAPRVNRLTPIVNAGSGADEHPTQALLDIYTIDRFFNFIHDKDATHPGGIDGKTFGFCGDIGRGRTIRSLAQLLAKYDDITMHFIAADEPELRLGDDIKAKLIDAGVTLHEHNTLDATHNGSPLLEQLDVLYMTRIQTEHDNDASKTEARRQSDAMQAFKMTPQRLQQMKPHASILHPFPRDANFGEIPPQIDQDPRAQYFLQARNGMWARAALLADLFGINDKIEMMAKQFT